MYTVSRTACASEVPAAAHTACRFSRQRRACSAAVLAGELAGGGVERDLAGAEQQPAGRADEHRVAVRADRRRCVGGADGLAMQTHRRNPIRSTAAQPRTCRIR